MERGNRYHIFLEFPEFIHGSRVLYGTASSRLVWVLCVFLIGLCINPVSGFSQWATTYGGDEDDFGSCIIQVADGGYAVAGGTSSFGAGRGDIWVLRLDRVGNIEWQKTYGGSNRDGANSIQQTSDGGYVVAGTTESFGSGSGDIWILKLRSNGAVEWQKAYGGADWESCRSILETHENGYIVSGFSQSFPQNGAWILKLDPGGNIQWQNIYPGIWSGSLLQTDGGGYIFSTDTLADDVRIVKIDPDGNIQWQKDYGSTQEESERSLQKTSDGGYIVSASIITREPDRQDTADYWILELDSNGAIQWQRRYDCYEWDLAWGVDQTADGGYIVTGWSTMKLDENGNVQWHRTYGGLPVGIHRTPDGGYVAAGGSDWQYGAGKGDFLVIKMDSNGDIDSSCEDFIRSTDVMVHNTAVVPVETSSTPFHTSANPVETSAIVRDTHISKNVICERGGGPVIPVPAWRQNIFPGDILYDPTFLGRIAGHVGIYIGHDTVVEAGKSEGVHETNITTWDERDEAVLLGVSAPYGAMQEAITFALDQKGKPYDTDWTQKNPDPNSPSWYCSELVWAAYFGQGTNLEYTPDPYVVSPKELHDSTLTYFKGRHGEGEPRQGVEIRATCPVELVVTDPDGLQITKQASEVPDTIYMIDDLNQDESPDSIVGIADPKRGTYRIEVVPVPGADPSSTYNLIIYRYANDSETILANEVPIANTPEDPYQVEVVTDETEPVLPSDLVTLGPNPVSLEGCVFWLDLPQGVSQAKLMILNVTGRLLLETPLDVDSTRFPSAGTWNPVDQNGVPLANGPYIYVLIVDDKVIGQGKMVIQR